MHLYAALRHTLLATFLLSQLIKAAPLGLQGKRDNHLPNFIEHDSFMLEEVDLSLDWVVEFSNLVERTDNATRDNLQWLHTQIMHLIDLLGHTDEVMTEAFPQGLRVITAGDIDMIIVCFFPLGS